MLSEVQSTLKKLLARIEFQFSDTDEVVMLLTIRLVTSSGSVEIEVQVGKKKRLILQFTKQTSSVNCFKYSLVNKY